MAKASSEWHSQPLHVLYETLGWFAFLTWSASFHPQVLLNFRRKSVVGLDFDYLLLNCTKHTCYLVYNACMFFVPEVHRQYREKYGYSELIPVGLSDVAYSIHAVLLTAITVYQVLIYEKGGQKLSKLVIGIAGGTWFAAVVCVVVAWPHGRWFWLLSVFNTIQATIALIKYIPQVRLNYRRKSTDGYSIENILLDLSGGIAYLVQMGVQSIDQHSIANFLGNNGKMFFALIVLMYDSIFLLQHFVLYHPRESARNITGFTQSQADHDTHVNSSEDNCVFRGICFIDISKRFLTLSERFPPHDETAWDAENTDEALVDSREIDD